MYFLLVKRKCHISKMNAKTQGYPDLRDRLLRRISETEFTANLAEFNSKVDNLHTETFMLSSCFLGNVIMKK